MPLSIRQHEQYLGADWWEWSVCLEGPAEELDGVRQVFYRLHPTFADPIQMSDDRASGFRITARGYGGFLVRARVVHRDGREESLGHELVLHYPDGRPTEA